MLCLRMKRKTSVDINLSCWIEAEGDPKVAQTERGNITGMVQGQHVVTTDRKLERPQDFGQGVNAPLPPDAKKILKICLRNGAF